MEYPQVKISLPHDRETGSTPVFLIAEIDVLQDFALAPDDPDKRYKANAEHYQCAGFGQYGNACSEPRKFGGFAGEVLIGPNPVGVVADARDWPTVDGTPDASAILCPLCCG